MLPTPPPPVCIVGDREKGDVDSLVVEDGVRKVEMVRVVGMGEMGDSRDRGDGTGRGWGGRRGVRRSR